MRKRFIVALLLCAALTSGCTVDRVDVYLRTDAKARLATAKLVNPSHNSGSNALALREARRQFPSKVRKPKPNQTYHQPVYVRYPMPGSDL